MQRLSANSGFHLRTHGDTVQALLHFAAHFLGALATGPTWHAVSEELAHHEAVVARDSLVSGGRESYVLSVCPLENVQKRFKTGQNFAKCFKKLENVRNVKYFQLFSPHPPPQPPSVPP